MIRFLPTACDAAKRNVNQTLGRSSRALLGIYLKKMGIQQKNDMVFKTTNVDLGYGVEKNELERISCKRNQKY